MVAAGTTVVMDTTDVKNRVLLIGASRGLGLALAASLNAPIPEPRFGVFRM